MNRHAVISWMLVAWSIVASSSAAEPPRAAAKPVEGPQRSRLILSAPHPAAAPSGNSEIKTGSRDISTPIGSGPAAALKVVASSRDEQRSPDFSVPAELTAQRLSVLPVVKLAADPRLKAGVSIGSQATGLAPAAGLPAAKPDIATSSPLAIDSVQYQQAAMQPYPESIAPPPPSGTPGSTIEPGAAAHSSGAGSDCPNCRSGAAPPCPIHGVHCDDCGPCADLGWKASRQIPWDIFAQGEYVGPARTQQIPTYHLRVDDELTVVYFVSRNRQSQVYRLGVGDHIRLESLVDDILNRELEIQPDGYITLPHIGSVRAAGLTVTELRDELDRQLQRLIKDPQITVTPLTFNAGLHDIINSVDRRGGFGGQAQQVRVTPDGTIQLPGIESVYVQGLSLTEMEREIEARYAARYGAGLDVTPIIQQRAPRFVYVVGEVRKPGRYTLEAPTTVMQAIALAGGWNVGAKLRDLVIFRRDDNWRLMATKVDIRGALYGNEPCPAGELWLRDSDIVVIPKQPVLVADEAIELLFTRGLYQVFPVNFAVNWAKLSSI